MASIFEYELLEWIDEDKLNWEHLSGNPYAMEMLEKKQEKINWKSLSANPYAIHSLGRNPEKIKYDYLCRNINAIHLLKKKGRIRYLGIPFWLLYIISLFVED